MSRDSFNRPGCGAVRYRERSQPRPVTATCLESVTRRGLAPGVATGNVNAHVVKPHSHVQRIVVESLSVNSAVAILHPPSSIIYFPVISGWRSRKALTT